MNRRLDRLLCGGITIMALAAPFGSAFGTESADYARVPASPFTVQGERFFPMGIYHFPKGVEPQGKYAELGNAGFNMCLLPVSATKEELDAAQAAGIRVMIALGDRLRFSKTIDLEARKADLLKRIGPGSMIYEHPAVIALEQPDEPLWVEKGRWSREGMSPELFAWARPPAQRERIHESVRELKDGYAWLREACGDRYTVWLNFAPRGHEIELRWYTELPPEGGYPPDPRTAADAFGTDVYPVPDGGGNNGWINGLIVRSPAAVGLFTDRLLRAVAPHPVYMVLQGCGIPEWDRNRDPADILRRPTLEELRFMTFQAVIHGARGILYWGVAYIEADSQYWGELKQVAGEVKSLAPVILDAEAWPEARVGTSRLESLALRYRGDHYVIAANAGDWPEARISVPGWKGSKAYSLLDGAETEVRDQVILDRIPPLTVRIYSDNDSWLSRSPRR